MTGMPRLGAFFGVIFAFGGRLFGIARFTAFLRLGLALAFPRFEAFLRVAIRLRACPYRGENTGPGRDDQLENKICQKQTLELSRAVSVLCQKRIWCIAA